ncbi:RNase H1/viroplasmin domain-containing protein [Flavipsychrobacter stenotrophus]|nr:RNase H1/viroplasmin domain-containing protein [Flavipsychrobacter stenotrophus]
MKKNFYVVFKGRETGIFKTWEETEPLVHRYPCSSYKGYANRQDAEKAFNADQVKRKRKTKAKAKKQVLWTDKFYVAVGGNSPAIYSTLEAAESHMKGDLNSCCEVFCLYEKAVEFLEKVFGLNDQFCG